VLGTVLGLGTVPAGTAMLAVSRMIWSFGW
jgi:hypothetical protein